MAHFYADIQGNRGEATRMGSKDSGINGHIRGWGSGARVQCSVDRDGNDVVDVYATSGSGSYGQRNKGKAIGLVLTTVNGKITFLATKKGLKRNYN